MTDLAEALKSLQVAREILDPDGKRCLRAILPINQAVTLEMHIQEQDARIAELEAENALLIGAAAADEERP